MKTLLPALLLAGLAGLAALAVSGLDLDYRIDAFLPVPSNPDQALVVDQISGGPGARLILAAVEGEDTGDLAELSQRLVQRWHDIDGVARVRNSSDLPDPETVEGLMRARFLLVEGIEERLEPAALQAALADRLSDLALGGRQVEALIRRDPLGLIPELADDLASASPPLSFDGVWFDASLQRALLIVESSYPAFDSEAQRALVDELRSSFTETAGESVDLTLAGPVLIGLDSAEQSRSEATRLSLLGSAFLLLILILAWRSVSLLIAGALPLAAGVVAGLTTVALAFDQVHGLTLAFGFTLLGVVLDYPVHLFGHAAGRRLDQSARVIAGPLLLGAASTLIAYLAIWSSTSSGLAQLGAFSAAGLAAAALTTLALPLLGLKPPDRLARQPGRRIHQPGVVWLAAALALGWLIWQGDARWSSDLSRLSPIDHERLAEDIELRQALGAGNVGQLLVLHAPDRAQVLVRTEATIELLNQAREADLIEAWQSPTDLLPSPARQAARRSAWPTADEMARALSDADPRFQAGAFEPFLDDLRALETLPELTPEYWQDTALAGRLDGLLSPVADGWRALILPVGIDHPEALGDWLSERNASARLVQLREVSEAMVDRYRSEAGQRLLLALGLIIVLLGLRMRSVGDTLAVIAPPLAAALCTAAIMSSWQQGLSLVHLIGLLLATGIGLDFALFNRMMARHGDCDQRTRRALAVCAISSGGVFLILGQSTIGMLNMLGLTVALGVLLSWVFARLLSPQTPLR